KSVTLGTVGIGIIFSGIYWFVVIVGKVHGVGVVGNCTCPKVNVQISPSRKVNCNFVFIVTVLLALATGSFVFLCGDFLCVGKKQMCLSWRWIFFNLATNINVSAKISHFMAQIPQIDATAFYRMLKINIY